MSINRWMDKEVVDIYTMEYYSAIKRNAFESVLMRWMNLEPIIQSEVSQKEKNKYSISKHIYLLLFSPWAISDSLQPWIAAHQTSLSFTISWSLLKLMSIELLMPSNHLFLCGPLLLLPPIPPSISLFKWVNSSHEVAKVLELQL